MKTKRRSYRKNISRGLFIVLVAAVFGVQIIINHDDTYGIAKQSSISVSQTTDNLTINMDPTSGGNFDKSGNQTISVGTDNYTGYTLTIETDGSRSMVNAHNDEIQSISTAIDEATFSSNNLYINKWGYKPSQYVTSNNGVNTTIQNTNYLPAPSTQGDFLAVTTVANGKDAHDELIPDDYTLSFATKVDISIPEGTYNYTYVLRAIANDIIYNITYNDSASGAASGMPDPNPQAITIDGGTPTAQSYGTLSNATPTLTGMSFAGWCSVPTTLDTSTGNYTCSGTVYTAGGQYPIDQTADGTNITLYAIWVEASSTYTISFNSHGGSPVGDVTVNAGSALGINYPDPDPTYTDHLFQGWYTAETGGDLVTSSTVPTSSTTYHAQWKGTVALAQLEADAFAIPTGNTENIVVTNAGDIEAYTFTSNDNSVATVDSNTGSITAVAKGTTTVTMTGAVSGVTKTITVKVADILCKLAKAGTLHVPTTSSSVTPANYGQIANSVTPQPGDAYDCNVDNDATHSATTERFYFLSESDGNLTLEAWNSYEGSNGWATGGSSANIFSYLVAPTMLPTTTDWSHPGLVEHTIEHTLNSQTTQATNLAARFMTYDEVAAACPGINIKTSGELVKCPFLMEHTTFDGGGRSAMWLMDQDDGSHWRLHAGNSNRNVVNLSSTQVKTSNNAARPAIVVPSKWVEKFRESYTISFNSHGGSSVGDVTVLSGDSLGSDYPDPDPTYTDHLFQGWYTAETGGDLVTSATIPAGNTTYHAQWKGTVALAQLENSNIGVAEGNTSVINVTNSADIESYSFTSNDTSVATVDSSTGVITGVDEGSTTITMSGDVSHATKIINVTVTASTVSYTISFNSHGGSSVGDVTVTAGSSLGGNYPNPDPTYSGHTFQGWYTAETGGTLVTSNTVPASSTTYHAQWKLDVTNAVISNNDLTLSEGGQITINVSNSADLEPYTFSSDNTSIATVDANTGVISGVSEGTTNVVMTGSQSHLTKTLEVDVTAAPVIRHEVTFNANGGESVASMWVEDGTAIGSLPTTTKANYRFFGWYTDDGTFYDEVYPNAVITQPVTYYARWVEDTASFPIEFAEINECQFNGNAVISGTYCTQDKTKKYVDSNLALFTATNNNYEKDFEIGFTITEYNVSSQTESQATLVNSKWENSSQSYPGFVMRRSGDNFQLTGKFSNGNPTDWAPASTTVKRVKIVRQNGVLKYSLNDGALTTWHDTSANTRRFDTKVWFGAAATSDNQGSQRWLVGKLTDMYVRLKDGSEVNYTINFNANGGTVSESSRTITAGSAVGATNPLPTPTPPSADYTFDAWYDESVTPAVAVSDSTVPDGDKIYVAHWTYNSSLTPVPFEVTNAATRGYDTIVTGLQPQITQFNEDTTTVDSKGRPAINFSTWGVDKTTYLTALKNNFETNNCMLAPGEDSQIDWGGSHTVNCSKPDIYDTGMGSALNVYLYDTSNQTHSNTPVAYAQANDGKIRNMIPGQSYYWEDANDTTKYGVVTATAVNNRRWLDVGNIWNVRDLGGLSVSYTDGNNNTVNGTLKYGKLIRGARLNTDGSDITKLINLGIEKEYDLAGAGELSPPDVKFGAAISNTDPQEYYPGVYVNDTTIHYNFNYGTSNYATTRGVVTDVMNEIINGNDIYFHCRVGADRTGTLAYLLEGLLGVPDEERYEDYEMTSLVGLNDRTRYYNQKSDTNYYKFLYMMGYTLTTQDIYDWYMAGSSDTTQSHPDADRIQAFRTAMVDVTPSGN